MIPSIFYNILREICHIIEKIRASFIIIVSCANEVVFDAMSAGAVDFIAKPNKIDLSDNEFGKY